MRSARSRLSFVPACQLPAVVIAGGLALDHGQADAGTGDRGADIDGSGVIVRADDQSAQAFSLLLNFNDIA